MASNLTAVEALEAYQEVGTGGTGLEVAAASEASAASCSLNEEAAALAEEVGASQEVEVLAGESCPEEVAEEVEVLAPAGQGLVEHLRRADEACQPGKAGSALPEVSRQLSRGARPWRPS